MKTVVATEWKVDTGEGAVSAAVDPATTPAAKAVFVCAHGAGGNMADRGVLAVTSELRERGLHVVRFNFLYRERGSPRPDPMPRLTTCVQAVVARACSELEPDTLIIGGRSMGGRACSMLAAGGFGCDGLLLLAYPLHPPNRPRQLRSAHLASIGVPVLCFNGTRDDFCHRELMEAEQARLSSSWTMHWIDGADHSFHVRKSSGRNDAQVLTEIGDVAQRWLQGLAVTGRRANLP